jgi:hypothetical protein
MGLAIIGEPHVLAGMPKAGYHGYKMDVLVIVLPKDASREGNPSDEDAQGET